MADLIVPDLSKVGLLGFQLAQSLFSVDSGCSQREVNFGFGDGYSLIDCNLITSH